VFDHTIFFALISVPCLVTGVCFWVLQKNISKREAARERRDEARKRNDFLLIKGLGAAITLGEETAKAVQRLDPSCNGDMSGALAYAQAMKREQKEFLQKQGIENLR